jgi:hypothetical protein
MIIGLNNYMSSIRARFSENLNVEMKKKRGRGIQTWVFDIWKHPC